MEYKESTDPIMIELQGDPIEGKLGEFGENKRIHLRIDVPVMRRLRRLDPPIDIRKLIDNNDKVHGGLYGLMRSDPGVVVDIAYEATRADPKAPKTTEAFAEGLFGDSLDKLTEAVIEAVVRFTPDRTNREAYRKILQKAEEVGESMSRKGIEKLDSGDLDQDIQEAISDAGLGLSGSTDESSSFAESSDSTLEDHSPSES